MALQWKHFHVTFFCLGLRQNKILGQFRVPKSFVTVLYSAALNCKYLYSITPGTKVSPDRLTGLAYESSKLLLS